MEKKKKKTTASEKCVTELSKLTREIIFHK